MIERTPEQQQMYEMIRVLRTMIRLKHSLAADRELNAVLPHAEMAFLRQVQQGVLPESIDIEAIAREAVPSE